MSAPAVNPRGPPSVLSGVSSALGSTIGGIADADAPLTALYITHYQALVGLARVLLRDHHAAEEVVQEAFIRVKASWRGMR
ncbi:MAG: hypothetical protein KY447_12875, partial [Actinobacteria bacterium]|nr:hypothetical protein [Actinomycetota bacterium]